MWLFMIKIRPPDISVNLLKRARYSMKTSNGPPLFCHNGPRQFLPVYETYLVMEKWDFKKTHFESKSLYYLLLSCRAFLRLGGL